MKRVVHASIDEYIAAAPAAVRPILRKIRQTIRKAAPQATETISYQIPTFRLQRNLVHFAAFKRHIGFFPPVRDPEVRAAAERYAGPRGNLQFQLDQPIPYSLISRIVKARVREEAERSDPRPRRR